MGPKNTALRRGMKLWVRTSLQFAAAKVSKLAQAGEIIWQLRAGEPGSVQSRDGIKDKTSNFSRQLLAATHTQMTAERLRDSYPH